MDLRLLRLIAAIPDSVERWASGRAVSKIPSVVRHDECVGASQLEEGPAITGSMLAASRAASRRAFDGFFECLNKRREITTVSAALHHVKSH